MPILGARLRFVAEGLGYHLGGRMADFMAVKSVAIT